MTKLIFYFEKRDPSNIDNMSQDYPEEYGNNRMDEDDRSIVESNIFDMGGNNELDQIILQGF